MTFHAVRTVDEVLELALVGGLKAKTTSRSSRPKVPPITASA